MFLSLLDKVTLDHVTLVDWNTQSTPQPLLVADDCPREETAEEHLADTAFPDFALFIKCLCLTDALDFALNANSLEEPACKTEGVTGATSEVETFAAEGARTVK